MRPSYADPEERHRYLRAIWDQRIAEHRAAIPHLVPISMRLRKLLGVWTDHKTKDGREVKIFLPNEEMKDWIEQSLDGRRWRWDIRDATDDDPIEPEYAAMLRHHPRVRMGMEPPQRRVYGVAFESENDALLFKIWASRF